jgi:hypothetical protein
MDYPIEKEPFFFPPAEMFVRRDSVPWQKNLFPGRTKGRKKGRIKKTVVFCSKSFFLQK